MTVRCAAVVLATAAAVAVAVAAGKDYPAGPAGISYGQNYLLPRGWHTFGGVTSQGLAVRMSVSRHGTPTFVDLFYRARCGRERWRGETPIPTPFRRAMPGAVRDARAFLDPIVGTDSAGESQGAFVNVAIRGARASATSWAGSATIRARIMQNGKVKARCRPLSLSWSARIPRARIRLIDVIGRSGRLHTPRDALYLVGDRRWLFVQGRDWSFWIRPFPGRRIHRGRLTTARDVELELAGLGGSGCGNVGRVDIRSVHFDRHAQISAIEMTVTQPCPPAQAPTRRVVVSYRR